MLNIVKGTKKRAVKVVITGSEGIGKSTLASKCPGALFVDTEGGSDQLDIARVAGIDDWFKLLTLPAEILKESNCCKTLVVDTLDWAEQMCIKYVCKKNNVESLERISYGKGYTFLYDEFCLFLTVLNKLIEAGINVVLIAHSKLRKQELPDEQGSFDRWEMKLSRQVAPLVKEWCDCLLFCNYKTYVVANDTGTRKAQGGARVIYTSHHPCWDAKNRFGLAEELPLEFKSIKGIFLSNDEKKSDEKNDGRTPQEKLFGLMKESGIKREELQSLVAKKGTYDVSTPIEEYADEFVNDKLIANWSKIAKAIEKDRKTKISEEEKGGGDNV